MAVIGVPRKLHEKFKFVVEIDGFQAAAFQKASELSVETELISYREGGSLIPIKDPGLVTFAALTLERGSSQDVDFLTWAEEVARSSAGVPPGVGQVAPLFKRNLSLIQRDRDNSTLVRYDIFNAFPTKYVAGDWDNTASDVVIETLTLEFDFWERITT